MKRIGALILGSLAAIIGLASVATGLARAFVVGPPGDHFVIGATAIPYGILLFELGLALVWFIGRRGQGDGERAATLPPWWASALIFVAAVGGGWLALRFDQWWAFFPLATVAVFVPIAAAGRLGLPRVGWRPGWGRLLAAFAWGAIVTPLLAIVLQLIAIVGVVFAAIFGLALGGEENLRLLTTTWDRYLEGRTLTGAQEMALLQWVLRQPLVLLMGASIFVVAAPATEELLKFAAVPLFGRARSRPTGSAADPPLTLFLLGLASGLGFAATENVLYVGQAGEGGWVVMAIVRGVTPLMHGTATALFALGYARQAQRPQGWALLWGALAALGLHAAWNLCAGLLLVASAFAEGTNAPAGLAILLLVLSLAVLGGLLLLCVGILLRQRRSLALSAAEGAAPPGGPGAPVSPPAIPGGFAPAAVAPAFGGPLPGRGETT